MTQPATKTVIVTEKVIADDVIAVIEEMGASGYTITPTGGKGARGVRSTSSRAQVIDAFSNVKIDVITAEKAMGERIADAVADRFFTNYSGIVYLEQVEILRPHKF
ncbi:MAG: hypothetical protein AAFP99_11575 [Pseudomonadota bacterium]